MFRKLEFITPTLLTVLDLFLEDPMREYHGREVVRRAHVSVGSANKMLRLLASKGFLIGERRGKMVFYRLNSKEPAVRQLKIFVNVYGMKELLDVIKKRCRKVVLFGSSARGTDVKESDVDMFVLTPEKGWVRKRISEFNSKNQRKIVPIVVDASEFVKMKREDKSLYENMESGVLLWQME